MTPTATDTPALERHYSPKEVAEMWGIDETTVRRLFDREPGVLSIAEPKPGRRSYTTRRIPESVLLRVHRRLARS